MDFGDGGSVISRAMAPGWGERKLQYERDALTGGKYALRPHEGEVFVGATSTIVDASGGWPITAGKRRPLDSYNTEEFCGTRYDIVPMVPWDRMLAYPGMITDFADRVARTSVNPRSLNSAVVFAGNVAYAVIVYMLLQAVDQTVGIRGVLNSDGSIIVIVSTFMAPVVIRAIFNVTSDSLDGARRLLGDWRTVCAAANDAAKERDEVHGHARSHAAFTSLYTALLSIVNLLPLVHADVELRVTDTTLARGDAEKVSSMLNGRATPLAALEHALYAYIRATDEVGRLCGVEGGAHRPTASSKTPIDRSWAHHMMRERSAADNITYAFRGVFVDNPVRFDVYLVMDVFFQVLMPIPMWQSMGAAMIVGYPLVRFLFNLLFGHTVAQAPLLDYGSGNPTRHLFTVAEEDARRAVQSIVSQ